MKRFLFSLVILFFCFATISNAQITSIQCKLQAPTCLTIVDVACDQITLKWKDNSSNEEGFYVYRKKGAASFEKIKTLNANATHYTDTGIDEDTTYCYKVYAFLGKDCSSPSNEACATTPKCPANCPPKAVCESLSKKEGYSPFTVHLSGKKSYDPDGIIVRHEWFFVGEGKLYEGDELFYTVSGPGEYLFELVVTDNEGAQDISTDCRVTIRERPIPPECNVEVISSTAIRKKWFDEERGWWRYKYRLRLEIKEVRPDGYFVLFKAVYTHEEIKEKYDEVHKKGYPKAPKPLVPYKKFSANKRVIVHEDDKITKNRIVQYVWMWYCDRCPEPLSVIQLEVPKKIVPPKK